MTKSKNKSIIALVVMAFMLVASIALAATGAWFTDKVTDGTATMDFGKIDIEWNESGALSVAEKTAATVVLPGDTIVVSGKIDNREEAAYIGLDISVTVEGKDKALQSEKKVVAVAKGAQLDLAEHIGTEGEFVLDGATYANAFQGKTITVTVKICAVQQKNVTLTANMDATDYATVLGYVTTNGETQGPQA